MTASKLHIATESRVDHFRKLSGKRIGYHRNHTIATGRHHTQRKGIITRKHHKILALGARYNLLSLPQIA